MTVGQPIGLLLSITFSIAAISIPSAISDAIETITSLPGTALLTDTGFDSTDLGGTGIPLSRTSDSIDEAIAGTALSSDTDSIEGS